MMVPAAVLARCTIFFSFGSVLVGKIIQKKRVTSSKSTSVVRRREWLRRTEIHVQRYRVQLYYV